MNTLLPKDLMSFRLNDLLCFTDYILAPNSAKCVLLITLIVLIKLHVYNDLCFFFQMTALLKTISFRHVMILVTRNPQHAGQINLRRQPQMIATSVDWIFVKINRSAVVQEEKKHMPLNKGRRRHFRVGFVLGRLRLKAT